MIAQPVAARIQVRILHDILLALRSLDGFREPVVVERGGQRLVGSTPRTLHFAPQARLRLATNLRAATAAWMPIERAQQALLGRFAEPILGEPGKVRVPAARAAEFRWLQGEIQDGEVQFQAQWMRLAELEIGANRLPLTILVYLLNLVQPEEIAERFAPRSRTVRMSRQASLELFAALLTLEGAMEELPAADGSDAEPKPSTVRWPYPWSAATRELLALDAHRIYLTAAEPPRVHRRLVTEHGGVHPDAIPAERRPAFQAAWETWLATEVAIDLLPIDQEKLLEEVPDLPIATLALLQPVLG